MQNSAILPVERWRCSKSCMQDDKCRQTLGSSSLTAPAHSPGPCHSCHHHSLDPVTDPRALGCLFFLFLLVGRRAEAVLPRNPIHGSVEDQPLASQCHPTVPWGPRLLGCRSCAGPPSWLGLAMHCCTKPGSAPPAGASALPLPTMDTHMHTWCCLHLPLPLCHT